VLKRSGFDTIVGIDLDKAGMDDAVRAAGDSLPPPGGRTRDRQRRDELRRAHGGMVRR
jgi:hypothetical protein